MCGCVCVGLGGREGGREREREKKREKEKGDMNRKGEGSLACYYN
jgi:hypothetical protein